MDVWSHRLANALVGNPPEAATLEVTLTGPEMECDVECVMAVTGAEFEVKVDNRPVPMNVALEVPPGSRVVFGRRMRGTRAYVALSGGISVPPLFGSRATHLPSAMGGLDGRALRAGDRLPLARATAIDSRRSAGPRIRRLAMPSVRPMPDGHVRVRVLPGPQLDYFDAGSLAVLQAAPYTIGQDSDRMGFRLRGSRLTHQRGPDSISDATPIGAIQVPGSGQPILLMADRQTTGGYPKIATLITADLGLAGQLGPGDSISFVVCTRQEAIAALIAAERVLMGIERTGAE
jgi:antagonist of KipI